jgi:B9 domain-containing protein 2
MAELHIIGQILKGSDFPDNSLYCKWSVNAGNGWKLLQGIKEGQTHVDTPTYEADAYWAHPVDLHYTTKGLQGWPKINFQVWHLDSFGRTELYGYGSCHIPITPGFHELECVTWRPMGSVKDQVTSYFLGGSLQLKNPDLFNANSTDELYRLKTISMGKVHLRLNVILRNFDKYGVEF